MAEPEASMSYHQWVMYLGKCLRFGVRLWWGHRPWVTWY